MVPSDDPKDTDPKDQDDKPKPEPKPKPDGDDLAEIKAALRKANKEAEESRRKLKEIEDLGKTDGERLSERVSVAERRADEAEAKALRLEVAASKGLTPSQARRLVGSTLDELEADADDLITAFEPAKGDKGDDDKRSTPGGRPKERLRGGGDPTEEPEESDPRKLAAAIPRY